jgi:cytochrome bd ubiquinol oxidase subunit II
MSTLQIIWFLIIGVLFAGYAILDGFDLGVGFWHLFTRDDRERRSTLAAIGPFWDGNEVWLITGGGALFAAFPPVYATSFSAMYLALMLVLFGLIFRAVSIEFRHQVESSRWRKSWDVAFAVGSVVPALLYGVAVGNLLRGMPLAANGDYTGTFFGLLNPYALLIGVVGLVMFAVHGALYIAFKTDGELPGRALVWAGYSWGAYLLLFVVAEVVTFIYHPELLANFYRAPVLWLIPLATLAALIGIGYFIGRSEPFKAFLCSAVSIAGMVGLVGASLFPNFVPALGDPSRSLSIANSSSSPLTLKIMLIIALLGMPCVIGYTVWIYRTFSGKVDPDAVHY